MADKPIAIIGLAGLFPQAKSVEEFWQIILEGKDCIESVPDSRWKKSDGFDLDREAIGKTYNHWGGFIPEIDFSPLEFGIPPQQLEQIDCAQLLSLKVAKTALEDAGYLACDHNKTGVILGVAGTTMQLMEQLLSHSKTGLIKQILKECQLSQQTVDQVVERYQDYLTEWKESAFPGVLANVIAGRISNRLNLKGVNCTIDAACASSLAAVNMAVLELQTHRSDLVLTGGVDANNKLESYISFSKTPVLSPGNKACSFDANADGTLISEGIGMMVLKRLDDAIEDKDRIYAVIKGLGVSSDGRSKSIFAPDENGQLKALQQAYQNADISPKKVGLIEAHSPGTRAGDDVELSVLNQVFKALTHDSKHIALSSVKSQIGHTKAAAGAASLIKTSLALYHKVLPASINIQNLNPLLNDKNSPFYINKKTKPWIDSKKAVAAVSSFGFGGANYHAVLEEAPFNEYSEEFRFGLSLYPMIINAVDKESLIKQCENLKEQLSSDNGQVAFHEQIERTIYATDDIANGNARLGFLAKDEKEAQEKLTQAINLINKNNGVYFHHPCGIWYFNRAIEGQVVGVFSGQGAQYESMGREFGLYHPEYKSLLSELDNYFLQDKLTPVSKAIFNADASINTPLLNNTHYTQTAIGALSSAYYLFLNRLGLKLDQTLGHSFGELTALFAAGSLDKEEYLQLIYKRGRLFSNLVLEQKALMLAIQADENLLKPYLEKDIYIANINSNQQTVVCGNKIKIDGLCKKLDDKKINYKVLDVSVPYHSPLISTSKSDWESVVDNITFKKPELSVHSNTSGKIHDEHLIAERVKTHPFSPVLFKENIEQSYKQGGRLYIEFGPKPVLSRFIDNILAEREYLAISVNSGPEKNSEVSLFETMLLLQLAGIKFNGFKSLRLPKINKDTQSIKLTAVNYVSDKSKQKRNKKTTAIIPAEANSNQHSIIERAQLANQKSNELHERFINFNKDYLQQIKQADNNHFHDVISHQKEVLALHKQFIQQQNANHQIILSALVNKNHKALNEDFKIQVDDSSDLDLISDVDEKNKLDEKQTSQFDDNHLLQIISDKTGYPISVLDESMQLEADLGIDSIKRVEIFAEIQKVFAVEIKKTLISELNTIQAIKIHIKNSLTINTEFNDNKENSNRTVNNLKTIFQVISEKTGYPENVLTETMQLEADLGIDSIKRVEIFSLLEQNLNHPFTKQAISELKTIKDIHQAISKIKVENLSHQIKEPELKNKHKYNSLPVNSYKPSIKEISKETPLNFHICEDEIVYIISDDISINTKLKKRLSNFGAKNILCFSLPKVPKEGIDKSIKELVEKNKSEYKDKILSSVIYIANQTDDLLLERSFILAKYLQKDMIGVDKRKSFIIAEFNDGMLGFSGKQNHQQTMSYGLSGLIKTLHCEWPHSQCRYIDINEAETEDKKADYIIDELFDSDPRKSVVSYFEDKRYSSELKITTIQKNKQKFVFDKNNNFIVTGGAGGITSLCIIELAKKYPCHFILLGRTEIKDEPYEFNGIYHNSELQKAAYTYLINQGRKPHPKEISSLVSSIQKNREINKTIASIKSHGANASYHAIDISEKDSIRKLSNYLKTQKFQIDGIIHGAGVLSDKLIQDKKLEDFDKVFNPKVKGLFNLLYYFENEISHLILFSSTASTFGNVGQSDYAMANEILNKQALRLKTNYPDKNILSIQWGPWDSGMVDEALKEKFSEQGVAIIDKELGSKLFVSAFEYLESAQIVFGSQLSKQHYYQPTTLIKQTIDINNAPFIKEHLILGKPVLPMAWVMLWISDVCLQQFSDYPFYHFKDIKLLQGIILDNDAAKDYFLQLKVIKSNELNVIISFLIYSEKNNTRYHYQGEIQLSLFQKTPPKLPTTYINENDNLEPSYIDLLYSGKFISYGSPFRGLKNIIRLDQSGVICRAFLPSLSYNNVGEFPAKAFNPYAYDIATHAVLIWLAYFKNAICLPSEIGSLQMFKMPTNEGQILIKLEVLSFSFDRNKIVYHLTGFDKSGEIYFKAKELQMTVLSFEEAKASIERKENFVSE